MYEPINGNTSSSLRKSTKILILIVVVVVLCVIVLVPALLLVKDKKHSPSCVLPDVVNNPPPPLPEPIVIINVPLPPTDPSNETGSCSLSINPRGTGCMNSGYFAIQSGSFLIDGNHILSSLLFSGAPLPPSPSSIYSGLHIVILKIDGNNFSNGDSWKCLTCGIPQENMQGAEMNVLDYPQTFHDGMRVLAGTNIIDCSPFLLTDDNCNPNSTFVYPIHWTTSENGEGPGGSIRELRLHPNNEYIGFNNMIFTSNSADQFAYFGRLSFNPKPTSGIPLVPRYEINYVTRFYNPDPKWQPLKINPENSSEILFSPLSPLIGEFRGWSKDGTEALWIGMPCESGNFDIMATELSTGATRRLTRNPGYTDPVDMSPDNEWIVVMDTRVSERMTFVAGMRGIPPLTDLATTSAVASIRNNGDRRFFEPILIDKYGDRGTYQGQLITAEGDGTPGSINDPNWNGMADPRWSPDGTSVAFWQALVTSPACGGINPLVCPNSTEPGQRRTRIFVAQFPDRKPVAPYPIPPIPENILWGTPYVPGSPTPSRSFFPAQTYILHGNKSGFASVQISYTNTSNNILTSISIAANYTNYSDDGYFVIDGDEFASRNLSSIFLIQVFLKSNLTLSGCISGRKVTSQDGYFVSLDLTYPVLESKGYLSTTIGNTTYISPNPGT